MSIQGSRCDIFISYRRKAGGLETAGRIRDRLKDLGYIVFMDLHNIKFGEEFPSRIVDAIKMCKEVLLVLPPDAEDTNGKIINALESEWVKFEICYAIKFKKRIIPIQMEGYKFPEKESLPELPEEFRECLDVEDKFRKIDDLNGMFFKNEYFDDCFTILRKNLKSHRKWNIKKKIIVSVCTILLLLMVLIGGKCIYNSYLPLFSLSLISNESSDVENDSKSWNMKYLISNKGGQLSGGKVIPGVRIGVKVVSKYEGEDYKYGFFDIEFYDFYEDDYFFDDQNNTVSIFETKADILNKFIYLMEEQLKRNDMYIDMYAIKTVFEIDYTDQFGVNHAEFWESENNYNYLWTGWGDGEQADEDGLIRYYSDNALVRVRNIDDALFSYPLLNYDSSDLEWSAKDIVKYINKHQNKVLKTNIYDIVEAEESDGDEIDTLGMSMGNAVEIISNNYGLAIGLHKSHEACNKKDLSWYERVGSFISDILR